MKKKQKKELAFWITVILGVTFAYFVWLTWNKLTEYIGDSNTVWFITGSIVLVGIMTGYFSWKKVISRFN